MTPALPEPLRRAARRTLALVFALQGLAVARGWYEAVRLSMLCPFHWSTTEMLVNYQGGFVRRGLVGEGVYRLTALTGADPRWLILPLCLACFLFVVAVLVRGMVRRGLSWWILPTAFGLASMGFCIIRKDFIVYALFILMLLAFRSRRLGPGGRAAAVAALLTVALLCYEGAFFMVGTAAMLLLWRMRGLGARARALCCALPVLVMALLFAFKGTAATTAAILDSWRAAAPSLTLTADTVGDTIGSLAWDLHHALSFNVSVFTAMRPLRIALYIALYIALLLGVSLSVFATCPRLFGRGGRQPDAAVGANACLVLLVALSLLPLWLGLSCDFGRILPYPFLTATLAWALLPAETFRGLFPTAWTARAAAAVGRLCRRPLWPRVLAVLLFLFFHPEFAGVHWKLLIRPWL